jgi:hypothetical protein
MSVRLSKPQLHCNLFTLTQKFSKNSQKRAEMMLRLKGLAALLLSDV